MQCSSVIWPAKKKLIETYGFHENFGNFFIDFEKLLSKDQNQKLRQLSLNSSNLSDGDGIPRLLEQLKQLSD